MCLRAEDRQGLLISGAGLRPVKSHRLEACATKISGWAPPTFLWLLMAGITCPMNSKLKRIAISERKNLLANINIYVNIFR
jgi:hypothetical protein